MNDTPSSGVPSSDIPTPGADASDEDRGEFRLSRILDASAERVYEAWTTPAQLQHWFGPEGMTVPADSIEVDARPGGTFALTMVAPDGTEYPQRGVYTEVVPGRRLVTSEPGFDMTMTITFTDLDDGRSELAILQTNVPAAYRGPEAVDGFNSTFDRLERLLARS